MNAFIINSILYIVYVSALTFIIFEECISYSSASGSKSGCPDGEFSERRLGCFGNICPGYGDCLHSERASTSGSPGVS